MNQHQRNTIYEYKAQKRYSELFNLLFKMDNNNDENIVDKWQIKYWLCWICRTGRLNREDQAQKYLKQAMDILKNNTSEDMETEEIMTSWMYIEMYKDTISKEELLSKYIEIKKKLYFFDDESLEMLDIDFNIALTSNNREELKRVINDTKNLGYDGLLSEEYKEIKAKQNLQDLLVLFNI